METNDMPASPGTIEERIARLESSMEALCARLDRPESAARQFSSDHPGRNWREQATLSLNAADSAFRRLFETRPVLAVAGLACVAVVLLQLLD